MKNGTQLRHVFSEIDERLGERNDLPLFSVSQTRGVIPRSEVSKMGGRADSVSKHKVVRKNDLVLNRFNAYRGSLGIAPDCGLVSPDYAVLRPHDVDPRFFDYWLRSDGIANFMRSTMGGLGGQDPDTSGFSRINLPEVMRLPIGIIDEIARARIADFLDRETAKIGRLIAKQKQLITTLGERRQAVIANAATRGLSSNRKMKDSGVDWLGEIPSDWDVKPLSSAGVQVKSSNKEQKEANLLSLSYGEIIRKDIDSNTGLLPESFETYQIVEEGDLVFRFTDLQNDQKSLRSALAHERGIITNAYLGFRPLKADSRFLNYLMRAYDRQKVFYAMGSGLRQSLNFAEVRRLPVVLPLLSEQQEIADFLDCETVKIDELIAKAKRANVLLIERRQSLISAAVTGKIGPTRGA